MLKGIGIVGVDKRGIDIVGDVIVGDGALEYSVALLGECHVEMVVGGVSEWWMVSDMECVSAGRGRYSRVMLMIASAASI